MFAVEEILERMENVGDKIFLVSVWLEEKEEKKIDEIQIFSS